MATISSTGIGSGLDVNNIITQMVALEKKPLTALTTKATTIQSQITAFGTIQSQFSALSDVTTRIAASTAWSARTGSSSNTSAATISVSQTAAATSFTLDVDALAKKQSISSATIAAGSAVGAGKLTFSLGTWSGLAASTAADALPAAVSAAAAATTAGTTAVSQVNAVKTALTSFATANPTAQMSAYATAYTDWANAVSANDHVTPALQTAETTALAARDTAYAALGAASPTLQASADSLATSATAAAGLAALSTGTPTVADYSSKYSAWVAASAANDGVTPTLIAAQATALTARDAARTALGVADPAALTAADAVTAAAAPTTAATSVAAWATAATAAVTASAPRATFTPAGTSSFSVDVTATDTVATLATKINNANGGVVATAFFDGTQDRLLLSSKGTGAAAGFRVQATGSADGSNFDNTGLSRMAFDPAVGAFGMASVGQPIQEASDAKARINGLAVTSSTNTLANNVPGVTINLAATTTPTTQVTMTVSEDVTVAVKNIGDFIKAYNDLNTSLTDLTKYDAATKTGALFQGDSSVTSLQNILRSMVGSTSTGSSTYKRLSDVGVEMQRDGSLTMNTVKLGVAANNGTELQKMFTTDNKNPLTNGTAIKFRDLSHGVLVTGGSVVNKATALQNALTRNGQEQTKINDHVTAYEARMRKQYSALDAKMAKLTALNSYVSQQVTTWNKPGA